MSQQLPSGQQPYRDDPNTAHHTLDNANIPNYLSESTGPTRTSQLARTSPRSPSNQLNPGREESVLSLLTACTQCLCSPLQWRRYLRKPSPRTICKWLFYFILSLAILVLIAEVLFTPYNKMRDIIYTLPWETGLDITKCPSRVSSAQAPLFERYTYFVQFDLERREELHVWTDPDLCGTGFQGNSDAYGLGVRNGLYLQWLSCLLANHTLPNTRQVLRQASVVFLIAVAIAIFWMTFRGQCIFAVEIVIMHIMFFGGLISSGQLPNLNRRGEPLQSPKLTWMGASSYMAAVVVLCHAAWFWVWAYDKHFVQMPCGTYNSPFGIVPDYAFGEVRISRAFTFVLEALSFAIYILLYVFIFWDHVKSSFIESAFYQGLFPGVQYSLIGDPANTRTSSRHCICRPIIFLRQILRKIVESGYINSLRDNIVLEGRDRLLNHLIHGVTSSLGFLWTVVSIEFLIRRNKITGVDTLNSVGQQIPLIVGIGGLIVVAYSLMTEKLAERRKTRVVLVEEVEAGSAPTWSSSTVEEMEQRPDTSRPLPTQTTQHHALIDLAPMEEGTDITEEIPDREQRQRIT